MLRDIAAALVDPRRFFAALRVRAPSRRRAFAALLLPLVASALVWLVGGDSLLRGAPPALARVVGEGGVVARLGLVCGMVFAMLLMSLLLWLFGWLPLRIGAGARPRLGELAAWTQLPSALVGALSMSAGGLGLALPAPLSLALGLASTGWSGWLVYEGLGAFAPDARWRGFAVWALFAGALTLLSVVAGPAALPRPSGQFVF